jgi:hypothetical protein
MIKEARVILGIYRCGKDSTILENNNKMSNDTYMRLMEPEKISTNFIQHRYDVSEYAMVVMVVTVA